MSKVTKGTSVSTGEQADISESAILGIMSGEELAALWGVTDRTVRTLAEEGIAVRVGHGMYDADKSTTRYIRHLRTEIVHRRMGVYDR
jgi:hypothetical protein